MAFKDLHYSLGKFKTDVRSQLARNNPMQKPDTKALSMWIFEERNDLAAMRVSAYHRVETTKSFTGWIDEHQDEDLGDIGDKLSQLMDMHTDIEREYMEKYQKYRQVLKTIRDRDENELSGVRERKRAVEARLHHLQKSNHKSRKIPQFEQELVDLTKQVEEKENEMADYKRLALREAFYVRFNALQEYAEKSAMVAGFGKYLVDLLDIEPNASQKPYNKYKDTDMIWMDCKLAVEGWQPEDERPTALDDMLSDDTDDAELLADEDINHTSQKEEEFNEKWTYVASLQEEEEEDQSIYGKEDPPPAYTPGNSQVVVKDEKTQASSSTTPATMADERDKSCQATDYRELYDQITQREKNAVRPRPYTEFQQQQVQKQGRSNSVSPKNHSQNLA